MNIAIDYGKHALYTVRMAEQDRAKYWENVVKSFEIEEKEEKEGNVEPRQRDHESVLLGHFDQPMLNEESCTLDGVETLFVDITKPSVDLGAMTFIIDAGRAGLNNEPTATLEYLQKELDKYPDKPWRGPQKNPQDTKE